MAGFDFRIGTAAGHFEMDGFYGQLPVRGSNVVPVRGSPCRKQTFGFARRTSVALDNPNMRRALLVDAAGARQIETIGHRPCAGVIPPCNCRRLRCICNLWNYRPPLLRSEPSLRIPANLALLTSQTSQGALSDCEVKHPLSLAVLGTEFTIEKSRAGPCGNSLTSVSEQILYCKGQRQTGQEIFARCWQSLPNACARNRVRHRPGPAR